MKQGILKKVHPLFDIGPTWEQIFKSIRNSLNIGKGAVSYPGDLILNAKVRRKFKISFNFFSGWKHTWILTKSIFSKSRSKIGQIVSFCWKVFRNSLARWFSVVNCLRFEENRTTEFNFAVWIDSVVFSTACRIQLSASLANSRIWVKKVCGRSWNKTFWKVQIC